MTLIEIISRNFIKIQVVIVIGGLLIWYRYSKDNSNESRFKVREADRKDIPHHGGGPDLAGAKLVHRAPHSAAKPPPLNLPGIRLNGAPHEILGIEESASETEIMKAYKEAIKRFHPDRIQGQAKEQIQFYQEASAKLNQAKEDMLKIVRSSRTS